MPKRIEFDGQIHEFPDDFNDLDIQKALSSINPQNPQNTQNQKTPDESMLSRIKDFIPKIETPIGMNLASGALGLAGRNSPQTELIRNLPQIMEGRKPTTLENVEKGIGEYAPFAISGGSNLLGQVASGAAYGASAGKPGESNLFGLLPEGKVGSALQGALINALTHGAFKGAEALRPTKLFGGNLTPKEVLKNLKAAEGTSTGLGDIIGSPFLKRQYENVISKLPFSGANKKLAETGEQVINKGENILNEFLPVNEEGQAIHPENATQEINNGLKRVFQEEKQEKNNLYDHFNKEADKQFIDLKLPNFKNKVKDHIGDIEKTNILKEFPEFKNILNKLNIIKEPIKKIPGDTGLVGINGEPLLGESLTTHVLPTAKEVNLIKSKLNDYAQRYKYSSDSTERYASGIFSDLSRTLKTDLKDAIKKSGNKKLLDSYEKAEKNHQENYSPFLDKAIYKYAMGKEDPDLLAQSFIKNSTATDRSTLLSKLTNKLSDREKKLLAYSYFSRAMDNEGQLNAGKLATLVRKLKPNQFKVLVPDSNLRNQLKNYNKLYGMNTKAVNLMQNPATGQQNLDVLPALMGHAGSAMLGNKMGGLLGALAGILTPGIAAKPLVSKLTNEKLREKFVNEMIKNKKKIATPTKIKGSQALLQGLTSALEK